MSEALTTAITKLSACVAAGEMARFTPGEINALLVAVVSKEDVLTPKAPVAIGVPGVFVSKGWTGTQRSK